ncbi:MAG: SDR family NAD(P)-dependent oxidoreductase, partial [Myxococcales bacterium]|nr:SDR family NAD(P)-dependent oxidoreductase [Myxococcales bacterium]
MDLTGKVAVVTGASQGLGAGLAKVALERGMSVALCSRSRPAIPDSERVLSSVFDVRDANDMSAFADESFERFGHVDLWVNNAGLLDPVGPLRDLNDGELKHLLDVNILGVALGSQAYIRKLHAHAQTGILMNISSGAGRNAYFGWSGYCASKAAVDRLSEVIAIEEEERLRVYSIAPGVIETRMQESIRATDAQVFRDVARFRKLKASGSLQTPEEAA